MLLHVFQQEPKITVHGKEKQLAIKGLHEQQFGVEKGLGVEGCVDEGRVVLKSECGVHLCLLDIVLLHFDCMHA